MTNFTHFSTGPCLLKPHNFAGFRNMVLNRFSLMILELNKFLEVYCLKLCVKLFFSTIVLRSVESVGWIIVSFIYYFHRFLVHLIREFFVFAFSPVFFFLIIQLFAVFFIYFKVMPVLLLLFNLIYLNDLLLIIITISYIHIFRYNLICHIAVFFF
jgi:hypothetical protein